ncbi:MAG: autotransporter-associated beta strand repeat-containing protein [Phycisphaerae bacterium]|nr:autotransporter-associated beta strand repeat-containing protein [Phycisphaerae bacterium]MDW8261029.1 autotransporter-associated beta strand repeat-containing protein [Phycisphaerales bacterium]
MLLRQAAAVAIACCLPGWVLGQVKAFPEAEGFGRFATGARTNLSAASVYHVTNLNDSGPGSFRDAVSQPNRFIVFDVSGVAVLSSPVAVASNLTIAGQTAPGGGFSLYGAKVSFTGAHNTIVRHLRIRKGTLTGRDDALSLADGSNLIFDHLSVTWGNDETFSLNPSSGATINNITIQNTIIGQGLDNVNHSAGGLIQPNGSVSLLRNLFIDNETRNPKAKGNVQFVNNVVYNWTTAAYILGGDSDGHHYANAQGNYFIQGPLNGSAAFTGGNADYHLYADQNFYDSNRNGILDGTALTQADYGTVDWLAAPLPYPAVNIESPQAAFARVVSSVGPSLYRDEVDTRMIAELSSLGTLGQIVVRETDLFPGYPGSLPSPPRPTDTDNDGIPDTWETTHGLDPNNPNDWKNIGLTGYTRLEEYCNELASIHPDKVWNAPAGNWPTAGNWSGGTPIWDDDAFVFGQGPGTAGAVTIHAPGATAFRLHIGGNGDAAIGETVTVAAGGAIDVMDSIHVGYQNTATLSINTGGTASAAAVVLGNGSLLGGTTQRGNLILNGGTLKTGFIGFAGGSGTFTINGGTIQSTASGTFNAPAFIGSGGANLNSAGFNTTFSGVISGTGALTKWGSGVVNLTASNTFTGGIVLRQGAIGVSSSSNLGPAGNPITFQGGTLRINGNSLTSIDSRVVNWSSFSGGIDVASASHTFSIASNLSGSGSLTKDGPGVLVLSGTNSHTGGTILRAGKLAITSSSNIGGAGSSISFQGGSLRVLGTALANLNAHNVNWSSFNGGFDIADVAHTFTVSQTIGGSGGLTKDGPGTLVLAAANTFTGNTIINDGVLRMGHPQALQFSTLNFPTGAGTLDLNGFALSIGGIAGSGGFDLAGGTLTVGSNNLSTVFSGVITDSVGGGRLVKVGTGNLTLTGNSSAALTIVAQQGGIGFEANVPASGASPFGTGNAGVLLNGGKLVRTSSGGAAWDRLFTIGPAGATLEGSTGYVKFNSTGTVPFSGTGNTTLTLAGSQIDNEFKFRLVDPASGKLAVNKVGSGRWIVSPASAMTYSGDTTISAGTFILNSGDNVIPFGAGKGNVNIASGAQFELNGRSVRINGLNGGGNLNHRNSTTETLELGHGDASGNFSGTITDTGTINLVKVGGGMQILSGANTYAGTTTVSGGVLQFNSASSIGGTGQSVTVNSGATVAAGYAINQAFLGRINPVSTGVVAAAVSSGNSLDFTGLNVSFGAVGSVSFSGQITPNGTTYRLGGGAGTLALPGGPLTGTRGLVVTGSGAVALLASNTFSGGTTVSGPARLIIGHHRALGSGSIAVNGGATLELAGGLTGTLVTPSLAVAPGGKLDLRSNRVMVDYSGASPLGGLLGAIADGRIFTSRSLTDPRFAVGYAEATEVAPGTFPDVTPDTTAVLLRGTLLGDAGLNGSVDLTDFALLASNFNTIGGWPRGDFNYDQSIGLADFALLASNFNQSAPVDLPRAASIPDPAGGLLGMSLGLVFGLRALRNRGGQRQG